MRLIFATHNDHKVHEVQDKLGRYFEVDSLSDIGYHDEIPETSETLRGNAVQKARTVYDRFQSPCFSDDTGLVIDALGGKPGVYSARYAGAGKNADANIDKVLLELEGVVDRKARFITYIALMIKQEVYVFEGRVEGKITYERRGDSGFGYDPIFIPDGHTKSFAQMTLEEKNQISHRALAMEKFIYFLHKLL
ncbi:MAG: RdgB/HAM1 family non-canonical purine NTP pyrophosphatase [Flavobacteriales bacterium]|nr:RdgB/HAM1 family non-canonical purine NTP pyrophosphatase [Flavobacteriales bacterium]